MSDKMRESAIALMEAAMIAGVDEYFSARPQLMRTRHEECLYEAGFKRAWQAAYAAALPPGFVAVPESALKWLYGEDGDFSPHPHQVSANGYAPIYWWRSEFRRRCDAARPEVK